jgi:hypothetical protein
MKRIKTNLLLLGLAIIFQLHLSGQVRERITGYRVNYAQNDSMQLLDSLRWTYSSGRGSVDLHNFTFDQKTEVQNQGNYVLTVNQFDAHDNVVESNSSQWDSGSWLNNYRVLYTYNASNRITSVISQSNSSGAWKSYAKTAITYDGHNDTTSYNRYSTDTSGTWILGTSTEFAYDGQYRHTAVYYFDVSGGVITDTATGIYYSYDNQGNLAQQLILYNDSINTLMVTAAVKYIWSSNNLLTSDTTLAYDAGVWVDSVEDDYSYNSQNLLAIKTLNESDGMGGLIPDAQYLYFYAPNQQLDTSITVYYSQTIGWYDYQMFVNTYNTNNTLESYGNYTPDTTGGWTLTSLFNYTYDADNNVTYVLIQTPTDSGFISVEEDYYYYENYDSTAPTSILNPGAGISVNVFPNPAHDMLQIAYTSGVFNNFELYNINGEMILKQEINPLSTRLSLNSAFLSPGNYLVRLLGENPEVTKKVVIQ